jgi:hypothetical protein
MPSNIDDDAVYRPRTILRRTADKRLKALKAERRLELVPPRAKPQAGEDDIPANPRPAKLRPGGKRPKR